MHVTPTFMAGIRNPAHNRTQATRLASPGLVSTEVDFGRRPAGSHAGFEAPFYLALNEIAYRN
jgi:hypothetical protein